MKPLRCVRCGHRLLRAAAMMPAVESGPMPHPAGAMGPRCAVLAGLLPPSLFTARRRATTRRPRPRNDTRQLELAA